MQKNIYYIFVFLLGFCWAFSQARASEPSPILHYDFNQPSGTMTLDSSPYGNTGYVYGAVFTSNGMQGGAYSFNGTGSYITTSNSPLFVLTNFTSCAWIKTANAGSGRRRVFSHQGATAHHWVMALQNNRFEGMVRAGTNAPDVYMLAGPALNDNQWHFLALVREIETETARLYIDGIEVITASFPNTEALNVSDRGLFIGKVHNNPEYFSGWMDEISLYAETLTSNAIYALYQSGVTGVSVGAVSCVIEPEEVQTEGAQWRLTMGPDTAWKVSGEVITNIPTGTRTMEFSSVSGWRSPTSRDVHIPEGSLTNVVAAYQVHTESVSNLLLHFDFNQDEGTTTSDRSGNNYHGSVYGAEYTDQGYIGGCLSFNGSGAYVMVPRQDAFDLSNLTACAWIKTANAGSWRRRIFSHQGSVLAHYWVMALKDNKYEGMCRVGSTIMDSVFGPLLNDCQWHFLAMTRSVESGESVLYIDGIEAGRVPFSSVDPVVVPDAGLYIGKVFNNPEYFSGLIDEVRLYNTALSPAEIERLFLGGSTSSVGLVTCTIEPEEVRTNGAQWRLTSGPDTTWKWSGSVVSNAPIGTRYIEFSTVSGWERPVAIPVQVQEGETTACTGYYSAVTEPTNDLVLYYSFDADEGSVVEDLSGNAHNGTAYGAQFVLGGCIGKALSLNGSTDYVEIPRSSLFDFSNFTACAWIKTSNAGWWRRRVISHQGAGDYWVMALNYNRLESLLLSEGQPSGGVFGPALNDDQWHFLAIIRDVSTRRFRCLVDGIQVGDVAFSNSAALHIAPQGLFIGKVWDNPEYFKGLIDELRIYRKALSDDELQALYLSPGAPSKGIVTGLIKPQGALIAGGQWRLTSGPDTDWKLSGNSVPELEPGFYTVVFKPLDGWQEPDAQIIQVTGGQVASISAPYSNTFVAAEGLVLYYDFDENGSPFAMDASGCGNHGIISNAVFTSEGTDGGALEFNGVNAFISVERSPSLNVSTQFTISTWIKPASYNPQGSIFFWWDFLSGKPGVHLATGVRGFQWQGLGTGANILDAQGDHVISMPNPPIGEWHHLALACDAVAGMATLYLNGLAVTTKTWTGFSPETQWDVMVGGGPEGYSPAWRWHGILDEVRLYNRTLSSSDIMALATAPSNVQTTASVSCQIHPMAASASGARWSLTSGTDTTWKSSGDILSRMPEGSYVMTFKPLDGWSTPSDQAFSVSNAQVMMVSAVYSNLPLSSHGLVLYYPFDTDEGGVVTDQSGAGNHGIASETTFTNEGAIGGSYQFDGVNSGIAAPRSPSLDVGDQLTACAWVKVEAYDTQGPVFFWWDFTNNLPGVHVASGVWGYQWHGLGTGANLLNGIGDHVISMSNFDINQWRHFAIVYDGNNGLASIYVNGILAVQEDLGAFVPLTSLDLSIGSGPAGYYPPWKWHGQLDEVRLYNRALNSGEINSLLQAEPGQNPPVSSISVVLNPEDARMAGAQWSLTHGPQTNWNESGSSLQGLPAGTYTAVFSSVTGWRNPSNLIVTLVPGEQKSLSVDYGRVAEDRSPPVILYVSPADGFVSQEKAFTIWVCATDDVGRVSVKARGRQAETLDGTNFWFEASNIQGTFNNIAIHASDEAGNHTVRHVNYAQAHKMFLTAMWKGYWRIRNPFPTNMVYTWERVGTEEGGSGVALANSDTFFETEGSPMTIRIYVNGILVDTKASSVADAPTTTDINAMLDSDGDGASNYEEELAGTDYNDPFDFPSLGLSGQTGEPEILSQWMGKTSPDEPGMLFTWRTYESRLYTLEATYDLKRWQAVPGGTRLQGTGGDMIFTNRFQDMNHFFLRLKIDPAQ